MTTRRELESAKARAAENILESCVGRHGMWAGNGRYAWQCWTRDFAFATMPYLLEEERYSDVRRHLETLSRRQRPNGQIPIVYLDGLRGQIRFLADKTKKSVRDRKMSFMLRRFLDGQLWNLTPGTRDSEILYLLAMYEYGKREPRFLERFQENLDDAIGHIESRLMVDGLHTGADWRDTMEKELANTPLLTNNCILYRVYVLSGQKHRAAELRKRILATHFPTWGDGDPRVIDYPGVDRCDPLGTSFAVLYDVAGPMHRATALIGISTVDSRTGVTIRCKHNPLNEKERLMIERTGGVVTWPFVVGFTVLALLNLGARAFAEEQFAKMTALDGFREYYDPSDATGYGEVDQLWSAVLYLRAYHAIRAARESSASE